ncbi:ATP-binding protein [Sphingomonas sp. TX0522]|jgi:two-component sensor histidine kinase|uniref:ATP-binding protein n=1 Tax=Sphingomonas sp. TX0522 TaxID=2479205 RepID=UPI0018E0592A|nr:sensor histidine kinase [Sphingomonas sp. TX0522]MBI0532038.1 sensor histidine kinase [Sphingomonas sp. TX0522]
MIQTNDGGILLRELSHRTANTLQVAVAALHLGRRGRSDLIDDALDRIGGAADLHGLLANVPAARDPLDALVDICHATRRAAGASARVELDFDLRPVEIPPDSAGPIGMIVTELVSNSIRHAFGGGPGRISVSIGPSPAGVEIAVEDDGSCAGWSRSGGQGRGIVDGLAAALGGVLIRTRTPSGSARVVMTLPPSRRSREAIATEAA